MKRAIVLSGGGAKGAYQLGFWKAIRELGISYDIVTGTSIGALNGVLMVQKDYYKAYRIWNSANYSMVLDDKVDLKYDSIEGRRKLIMKYAKGAIKGGLSVSSLEKTIKGIFNADKFFNSNIDYGLVTVKFPSLKPIMMTKDMLNSKNAPDYFLASASCFPAFKMKDINDEKYIDGGFYDNLPINLAIKMKAEEIIAVDLKAVGNVKKVNNKDVKIITISPKNEIGNFLVMEKKYARRAIKFGYNDTLKVFNVLEGDKYTFKRGSLKRNFKRNSTRFYDNLNYYVKDFNIKYKNNLNEFNKILEQTAKAFNIAEEDIYRVSFLNILIKNAYKKHNNLSFKNIKSMIKKGAVKRSLVSKELICYIYNEIIKNKKNVKKLSILFPNSFLCAIYLKTILRK